jgi:hypothetical protein
MATKKQRRTIEIKSKKKKKTKRTLTLYLISAAIVGFLVFFFVTLFNYLYPPTAGKGNTAGTREKRAVTLYFSDTNERFLVAEKRYVVREQTDTEQAAQITKALLDGSKTGLVNTFPDNVKLQKITIDKEGIATVSFSPGLIERHPGGSASEMATVYSLTNTLAANIPIVKRVRILVNNGAVKSIKGHIDAGQPFVPKKDLMAPISREG